MRKSPIRADSDVQTVQEGSKVAIVQQRSILNDEQFTGIRWSCSKLDTVYYSRLYVEQYRTKQ
jgi:hypothetical protein